jgi:hypothetical protein
VSFEELRFAWRDGEVSGARHRPSGARRATLVFAHGAGGSMKTPYNVAIADALAAVGVETWRFNFPYSEAGRRAPDKQDKLESCYWGVAKTVEAEADRLYLGGQSMGGRMATHIVADGFPVEGLVLQSYPLHPPGKPEKLRDAHLPRIGVPMLFISGTKDGWATGDLLDRTVARLPTATLHRVEGAGHGLTSAGRSPADIMEEVVSTIIAWMG